jgi:hypothetical protein
MLHLRLIILLVGGDVPVDSEAFLVTDFVNLKIKPARSFGCAHRGRMYVHVFIGVSARTCISICVCTVFLKKIYTDIPKTVNFSDAIQEAKSMQFTNI